MKNKIILFSFIFLFLFIFLLIIIPKTFATDNKIKFIQNNGLYLVKIPTNNFTIEPYVSDKLETLIDIAEKKQAIVAINTGFFDASNSQTISYIINNGKILANPTLNENLNNNAKLKPYLKQVYNRGEIRFLTCNGNSEIDITYHNKKIKNNCILNHSTQAGPILLPEINLNKEFFIIKENNKIIRDSIGINRKTARSAIGIKDRDIYFIITNEYTPLTIFELQNKLKKMNFEKALALDGGGSVSLFLKQDNIMFYQSREKDNASRKIKSALIVK